MELAARLALAAGIDFGVQWAAWVASAYYQTEMFYDLTGTTLLPELLHLLQIFPFEAVKSILHR